MMEEKRVKFLFSSNIERFGGDRKRFKIFQSVLTKTVQTFVVRGRSRPKILCQSQPSNYSCFNRETH